MATCFSYAQHMLLAAAIATLCACASKTQWDQVPRQEHVVRSGETLYEIAWRYGRKPADLARWNGLGDGSLIFPGQVIRLSPPAGGSGAQPSANRTAAGKPRPGVPAQPTPVWRWPANGDVKTEFGARPGSGTGLLIAGTLGDPVKAAAGGRVVYAGSGLIGYGKLIIVKHNDTYLSAYGYNESLLVKEGDAIRMGQRIATLGEGPGREPRLHFEIRRNGEPVNPRQYLPAR